MADNNDLTDPWLVAVWPGMGNVALGAGGYLVADLKATLVYELPAREIFEIQNVEVKDGLARAGKLPRNMFFQWRDPKKKNDLLIFIGQAQPPTGGYALCHHVLDYAQQRGVKRIITFAALATQLHPSDTPRVLGIATENDELQRLKNFKIELLEEGQISGLNGVLLAAGAERNLPGVCLMGEIPFFAVGVPNPRASQAVLESFSAMVDLTIDYTDINQHAKVVEEGLLKMLEKMREAARQEGEGFEQALGIPDNPSPSDEGDSDSSDVEPQIDDNTRLHIESLFAQANEERSRAFLLKEELDRLGLFEQYENRFLDLFKKAE